MSAAVVYTYVSLLKHTPRQKSVVYNEQSKQQKDATFVELATAVRAR